MPHRTELGRRFARLFPIVLGALVLVIGLVGTQPASAQTCIDDIWKADNNSQDLTCTANDVTLSEVSNVCVHTIVGDPTSPCVPNNACTKNQPVTFTADFRMVLTAQTRYDVGFYIATDGDPNGDGALTGGCTATQVTSTNAMTTFRNLDAAPDTCGDITGPLGTAFNPQIVRHTLTTTCVDADNDGFLELPFCTTWRQPGSNEPCDSVDDAFPGSPSKCNCGTLQVEIFVEPATGAITKTVTKATITYEVEVSNTTATRTLTVNAICDDVYGALAGSGCAAGSITPTNVTCTVPQDIAPGDSYTCQFDGEVPVGSTGLTDTVTATVVDDENASVDIGEGTASVQCTLP